MPALIEAGEALTTVGEMTNTLQKVYGRYDGGPEMQEPNFVSSLIDL